MECSDFAVHLLITLCDPLLPLCYTELKMVSQKTMKKAKWNSKFEGLDLLAGGEVCVTLTFFWLYSPPFHVPSLNSTEPNPNRSSSKL